ncbi:putative f-box domain-containing protein [Erysiphe necator]|uniref:Putative f-box domain-containing protein n=1 Tax=Uncinula necator TaxID=52586 RepID=A0A0B1P9D5_UNCNE|nr:putative f-box domain-containing protein [Erysiphe necator]
MELRSSELDEFRENWRQEVSAKLQLETNYRSSHSDSQACCQSLTLTTNPSYKISQDIGIREKNESLPYLGPDNDTVVEKSTREIQLCDVGTLATALDHYELAVKREDDGNLGESLDLYRKAFHMDHRVDRKYKNKYFPTEKSIQVVDLKSTQDLKSDFPNEAIFDKKDLVESLSSLSIQASASDNEDIVLSCPLASLPDEILVHILMSLAILDVASFVRIAQVCKKLAYLVATEQQIWRRICIGSEFGFGGMHYEWQPNSLYGIFGKGIINTDIQDQDQNQEMNILSRYDITKILLHNCYSSSWYQMFRLRPRIRFNGCYISTINYLRPGESSSSQASWNNPIHIVTYYRFLRFFRDGTVISLLTTNDPVDVVPYITKEYLDARQVRGSAPKFMRQALRGRWHMAKFSGSHDVKIDNSMNNENDIFLETEGVNEKYLYQMKLSLRSSNKACKNNKLIWRDFRSINRITNEIDQFRIKEEKAFFWSRVKRYANG